MYKVIEVLSGKVVAVRASRKAAQELADKLTSKGKLHRVAYGRQVNVPGRGEKCDV